MIDVTAALAQASLDGLMAFDGDRRCTYWNDEMERLTGLPAAAVMGRAVDGVFVFSGDATAEPDALAAVLRGETVVMRGRRYAIEETGRGGWFDARCCPMRDSEGAVAGGCAVVRDITERKAVEARIAETERRFQNMADASPVLLWMADTDSMCTFFNHTWLTFTGRSLRDEWGLGWAEGVHFEDLQRCVDTYEKAFNDRRAFEMEYRLQRADGEFRWILDRGVPRYEPDGTFAGFIGSCTDLTDRRALEVELREKLVLRDEFLGIASHELRTPLGTLRLTVDGLVRNAERGNELGPEERLRRFRAMRTAVDRLEHLVTRLLDVSRIRVGNLGLAATSCDLAEIARGAAARMREEASRSGTTIEVDAGVEVTGAWDRERVDQMVVNLISNAMKYGAGKPVKVSVSASTREAKIVVRDEGIGIAPEDQKRIFNRFERAVSSRSFGGFGLGLWIASEIVRASGGRIEVLSALGAGATFTAYLPRGAA